MPHHVLGSQRLLQVDHGYDDESPWTGLGTVAPMTRGRAQG